MARKEALQLPSSQAVRTACSLRWQASSTAERNSALVAGTLLSLSLSMQAVPSIVHSGLQVLHFGQLARTGTAIAASGLVTVLELHSSRHF